MSKWLTLAMALAAGAACAQTPPGTPPNPIKGGAAFAQLSRNVPEGSMSQGRVVYYECGTQKTQVVKDRKVTGSLTVNSAACDELPGLPTLQIDGTYNHWLRLATASGVGTAYQGLHTMTLVLRDAAGVVYGTLDCEGSNGVGTHRPPTAQCEPCTAPNHFEGRFKGAIENGTYRGTRVWGTYAGSFTSDPVPNDASWTFRMTLDGVNLRPCEARFKSSGLPGDVDPIGTFMR